MTYPPPRNELLVRLRLRREFSLPLPRHVWVPLPQSPQRAGREIGQFLLGVATGRPAFPAGSGSRLSGLVTSKSLSAVQRMGETGPLTSPGPYNATRTMGATSSLNDLIR